jgi:hypothetical protein
MKFRQYVSEHNAVERKIIGMRRHCTANASASKGVASHGTEKQIDTARISQNGDTGSRVVGK